MARSTFAVPWIDPIFNITYLANSKVSEKGFKEVNCDGEKVWCRENTKTNTLEFIKFDFGSDVFIYSVWIKFKDDPNPYREYNLDYFENDSEETKTVKGVVGDFWQLFGRRLKRKTLYIYT